MNTTGNLRRALSQGLIACVCTFAATVGSAAADEPTWRLEQPAAPAPAPGVAPAPFPVPLGPIGDMAFWSPNRGILTTAGNGVVPMGLYVYDGAGWRPLATVCGATSGRLAWAGPTEFWTVADQRAGQTSSSTRLDFRNRSLCQIAGGRVTASFALPQGQADSYLPMRAAACLGPNDCWFGGDVLSQPPPFGAFHLHWDGRGLTATPSAAAPVNTDPPHGIQDLVTFQNGYFESVEIESDDPVNPAVPDRPSTAARLHAVVSDPLAPFVPLQLDIQLGRTQARRAVLPTALAGFQLDADGNRMWAVAGSVAGAEANVVIVTLDAAGSFQQIQPQPLPDGSNPLPSGTRVMSIAADPGQDAVWIAYATDADGFARVARVAVDGTITRLDTIPAQDDPTGPKGTAARIVCPAAGQCWLATERGWLFHLTDGTPLPRDTDPAFASVITTRPPDNGVPFVPPIDPPLDDSLLNAVRLPPAAPGDGGDDGDRTPRPGRPRTARSLVTGVHSKLVPGTTVLKISFRLRAAARVTVVARRRHRVVARTKTRRLARGRHTVRLRLNARRWPTALAVQARAVRARRGTRGTTASFAMVAAPAHAGHAASAGRAAVR